MWDGILFGSDYPFATVDGSVEGMRRLNEMLGGMALQRLDMYQIKAMFSLDTLGTLEIEA